MEIRQDSTTTTAEYYQKRYCTNCAVSEKYKKYKATHYSYQHKDYIRDFFPSIVAVSGGFSILHTGHIRLFKNAKKYGGRLIVILNNDNWLLKKQGYVLIDEKERKEILESIKYIDKVYVTKHKVNDVDVSVCNALRHIKPDVFVNGGDQFADTIPEYKLCKELGITMKFNVGGGKTNSSSEIVKKLRGLGK